MTYLEQKAQFRYRWNYNRFTSADRDQTKGQRMKKWLWRIGVLKRKKYKTGGNEWTWVGALAFDCCDIFFLYLGQRVFAWVAENIVPRTTRHCNGGWVWEEGFPLQLPSAGWKIIGTGTLPSSLSYRLGVTAYRALVGATWMRVKTSCKMSTVYDRMALSFCFTFYSTYCIGLFLVKMKL